jgi:hypothetical protein
MAEVKRVVGYSRGRGRCTAAVIKGGLHVEVEESGESKHSADEWVIMRLGLLAVVTL